MELLYPCYSIKFHLDGHLRNRLRLRLEGGNEIELKDIKRMILEYSSLFLFGSFNRRNGKSIPLFWSLSKRE